MSFILFVMVLCCIYINTCVYIVQAIVDCEEIIGACIINGVMKSDCYKMFTIVQTDMGFGCAINKIPDSVLIR